VADRPSLHKQLMFLPSVAGTALFVTAPLGVGGFMNFVWFMALLFLATIPFQYSYGSLFPVEPHQLREANVLPSILLVAGQLVFWVALFLLVSRLASQNGT